MQLQKSEEDGAQKSTFYALVSSGAISCFYFFLAVIPVSLNPLWNCVKSESGSDCCVVTVICFIFYAINESKLFYEL